MKKKLLTLLAAALLCMGIGCGISKETEPPVEEDFVAASIVVDKESMPPLDRELQQFYKEAYKIYAQVNLGRFNFCVNDTTEKHGMRYYRIIDSRFRTYDDLYNYLLQYFTADFVDNYMLQKENIMYLKGDNGGLYFLALPRSTNPFYAGHTFDIDKEGKTEMGVTATVYYTTEDYYTDKPFYKTPKDPEAYQTKEYRFPLVQENGSWKFDDFYLFF